MANEIIKVRITDSSGGQRTYKAVALFGEAWILEDNTFPMFYDPVAGHFCHPGGDKLDGWHKSRVKSACRAAGCVY